MDDDEVARTAVPWHRVASADLPRRQRPLSGQDRDNSQDNKLDVHEQERVVDIE